MSKHILSAEKWLIIFAVLCILIALCLAAFNFVTDPFGAFGDRFFQWWSYDETNNPRVAKISYLEQHHEEYDSYIIGCSSTSSYPKKQLDEYFDADFYNLIMYGADMLDVEETVGYITENYEVKNLVLNVYIDNGIHYDTERDALTYGMHYKADGSSAIRYFAKYLFANPSYGLSKLRDRRADTYLQQAFDVFDEVSGAYDKSRRDAEAIGDMGNYLEAYPIFENYSFTPDGSLTCTAPTMESIARIKAICNERGVNFLVVSAPVYREYYNQFDPQEVRDFYTALASVTDYWDFSFSSVSCDPRYFYDETHFRNSVGEMALARIFGDETVYVPDDFGVLVTRENVADYLTRYSEIEMPTVESYTKDVPILMYHHLDEVGDGGDTISVSVFEEQIKSLAEAGYTSILFSDLYNYVHSGTDLPEKSVVITFDDGYLSNYTLAMPILEKYGMRATVFAIGVSIGKDTYKDTGRAIHPHFSLSEAKEMISSGVFDIQSHSYDFHQVAGLDSEPVRSGILQLEGESESEYIAAIQTDCDKMNGIFEDAFGKNATVFAYPYGFRSLMSNIILRENGIVATVTTEEKSASLIKGLPQSLLEMGRFFATDRLSGDELLSLIEK